MEKPGGLSIPKKSNNESSSEELAFAEDDAAGSLWPPRSYTCSFCRREFKTAQSLGGHMNVHRRDRARLKSSSSDGQYLFSKFSSSPECPSHNDSDDIRETSCYTLVFNSKTNRFKSHEHSCVIDLSSSSLPCSTPSRVSSGLHRKQDTCPFSVVGQKYCDLYEIPIVEGEKKRKIERDMLKTEHKAKLNLGNTTDISVSMNLVIHQKLPIAHEANEETDEDVDISKRRRRMHESPIQPSIFVSRLSCKGDIITTRNEEIKPKGDRFEDIDLELRLGTDPPKEN